MWYGAYKVCKSDVYDNNSIKDRRGEIELYYCKGHILCMKQCITACR